MTVTGKDRIVGALPPLRRRQVLAAMAGGAVVGLTGFPSILRAAPSGNLRVAANANPSSLDPTTGGAGSDHPFLYCFYDTLVDWDYATLSPRPGLAQSYEFTDPTTLVLKLVEGATFHDGTPFDAAAAKFNLDRNRSATISNIKRDVANIAEVEATDATTVTIKLSAPDTALPLILSDRAGMMVSPTALKNDPEASVDRAPVGTGPWSFVSWADGEKVVGKAFDKHWRPDTPRVAQIDMQVIPEPATALRSVQSGQSDIAYQLSERQKALVERMPTLQSIAGPTLYVYQFYINAARGALTDQRVRKALNLAIDRDAYVLATMAGVGEPAHMQLPKAHWAYAPEVESLTPYDPDEARALMKEAGLEGGLELDFRGYPDQASVQRQEVLLEQLSKIGVRGRFQNAPIAENSARFFGNEKQGDLLLSAWTGRPDPSLTYSLLYSETSYYNPGRVKPPAGFEEALQKSRSTQVQEERAAALAEVQKLVMDAALTIPLAIRYEVDAATAKVENFEPNLLGKPKFTHVGLKA